MNLTDASTVDSSKIRLVPGETMGGTVGYTIDTAAASAEPATMLPNGLVLSGAGLLLGRRQ
jgi:hypothetical protein